MQFLKPTAPRAVLCPSCGHASPFTPDNPYRPFCSQRCKLIDLGQWANEAYRVPDPTPPPEATDT